MCYIDGQKNKYSVLNESNRMLKYNIFGLMSDQRYVILFKPERIQLSLYNNYSIWPRSLGAFPVSKIVTRFSFHPHMENTICGLQ
jgi:hypothetical protein